MSTSNLMLDVDQAGELKAAFRREGSWTNEEIKVLCERKGFLTEVRKALKGYSEIKLIEHSIGINRLEKFDPATFMGDGWTIEEEDERALTLAKIDLSQVQMVDLLKRSESNIKGEKKLKRLKEAGYICLDAKVFQTLWESKSLIPECWKEKVNGKTRSVFFDGTVLRSPAGIRLVLFLSWFNDMWHRNALWLECDWCRLNVSAVLAR